MEHTKGDWEVIDRWNVLSGKRLVANCGGYFHNVESVAEESEANAHLIAAAPRLYEWVKGRAHEGDNDAKCFLVVLGLE